MSDHVRPYPDSTRNKKWPVLPSAQAPLLPVPEIIKLTEDFHCHNMMTWRQHLGYYVDDHFQETSALEKAKPSYAVSSAARTVGPTRLVDTIGQCGFPDQE